MAAVAAFFLGALAAVAPLPRDGEALLAGKACERGRFLLVRAFAGVGLDAEDSGAEADLTSSPVCSCTAATVVRRLVVGGMPTVQERFGLDQESKKRRRVRVARMRCAAILSAMVVYSELRKAMGGMPIDRTIRRKWAEVEAGQQPRRPHT